MGLLRKHATAVRRCVFSGRPATYSPTAWIYILPAIQAIHLSSYLSIYPWPTCLLKEHPACPCACAHVYIRETRCAYIGLRLARARDETQRFARRTGKEKGKKEKERKKRRRKNQRKWTGQPRQAGSVCTCFFPRTYLFYLGRYVCSPRCSSRRSGRSITSSVSSIHDGSRRIWKGWLTAYREAQNMSTSGRSRLLVGAAEREDSKDGTV